MYCCSRTCCKCCTLSLLTFLTPKSSAMRQIWMGCVLCVHNLGSTLLLLYQLFAKHCSKSSCTNNPVCGNPYMPFLISTYTHPSSVALVVLLWYILQYNHQLELEAFISFEMGVKVNFFISIIINFAPFLDMVLIKSSFMVSNQHWAFHNHQGSLFCHYWQSILSCWALFCLVNNCIQFDHIWSVCALECPVCWQKYVWSLLSSRPLLC